MPIIDQETLLEQIVAYTIGANEMIPDIASKAGEDYQIAILPYGPHFYTGILQSAGYLLLPARKKLLLIIEQDQNDKKIYQLTGTFGPILGHQRTFHTDKKTSDILQAKSSDILSSQSSNILLYHLAYMQTISKPSEITCLAIESNLSAVKHKKLNDYLRLLGSDTNIVFLSNVTVPSQTTNFPMTKLIKENTGITIKTFHSISKKLKRSSEIIAYSHGDKKSGQGYACILA